MILKSLMLQGFKSFPDKTEIKFLGGITAIVGPNGSGKSNISDAIRWVLGEQSSRSLRGAKMEDVIFGGTAKRGPQGFAEVSLVLNNESGIFRSEYIEVMVTRRYYRSGESEYFLNKKHCRLRDIHELFMDTGLGRDGYSSIGQGRIDEILSLRSEERREIFEEAAGVTKFRYRKEEAERKLTATEDNLVRIRDLYGELESQRGPLERQAEKAKEYLLLRDELRVLEVSLWLRALERIRVDGVKAEADAAACEAQLADANRERDALYARSEKLADDLRKADVETDTLRTRLRETEQRQADSKSRCAVLRANIRNAEENRDRALRERARQNERADSLDGQLAARRARLKVLDAEKAGLDGRAAENEAACARLRDEQNELLRAQAGIRQALEAAQNGQFTHELARTAAQTALDGMEARKDTIETDLAESEANVAREEQTAETYRTQLDGCMETLARVKNQLAGVALKADGRRHRVQEQTAAHAALTARAADCENRIRMLTELQKDYEGFSRAVKLVMGRAETGALHGVHGPVSSLLTVEPKYITAIETALGAAGANLVVDTAADAKRAIEFLKRKDGGRATFLPIDTIRPAALREQGLENEPGCHGTADRLVVCDEKYRDIISNLLARTVVADDLDAALRLAKTRSYRFRIVTLDGQLVQAGGAMTGGSASKSSGVLARAEQLRQLTTQQTALREELRTADERLAHAKDELAALDYDLKAIEAERARAQEDEARLTAQREQHALLLDSLRARHEGLTRERADLDGARAAYEDEIARAEAALEQSAQTVRTLEEQLNEQQTACAAADSRLAALSDEAARLRTAQAENRTEAASEQRALDDLEQVRASLTTGAADAEAQIEAFRQEAEHARAELAEAEQQAQAGGEDADKLRALIAASSQQRLRVEADKTAADKAAQAQNDVILNLERESARLNARVTQLAGERSAIHDKLWETYELTPTPAEQVAVDLPDPAGAQERAQELRSRMRALGSVNLDAVDEYAKLMERFTFLGEQKDDLEHAQAELYRVIEQLTVRMKEIFASEFAKLNAYFGETFREIFGGGSASLQLADTSDILHCGIDILVCPPGKALKTLTLLSGGEKAFVAIALYFAILKLRPTPFCVLDEIEAALDDVNVTRFAEYLKRLADKTQFIVITHRRGTMEAADMLYGVTMQEQGVSRLLMLNLAEAEKHIKNS